MKHPGLILALVAVVLLGASLAGDYGAAIDDASLFEYREHTMLIYREALQGHFSFSPGPDVLRYYGPAFLTTTALIQDLVLAIFPQVQELTIWHFLIFASFLAGLPALYYIARLLFNRNAAIAVVLLYATQPLLWGHGFINGKDIPFLSFFLLSVAAGLRLDSHVQRVVPKRVKDARAAARSWSRLQPKWSLALGAVSIASALQLVFPNWPEGIVRSILNQAVADKNSIWGALFERLAAQAHTIPLESYVQKALLLAQTGAWALLAAGWAAVLVVGASQWPASRAFLLSWARAIPWRTARKHFTSPAIWAAGLSLAFAWAIRVMAPFAWLLAAIFLLARKGAGAIPALLVYGLIASLGVFVLWPFLWEAPVRNMWDSLVVMGNFPQQHMQLLNGRFYAANEVPFYAIPELIVLQFTLPFVALMLAGAALLARGWAKQKNALVGVLLLWVGLPLSYSALFTPTTYNNFRQWLFILPPLFILAGYALEALQRRVRKQPRLYWAALLLCLLPGLWSIASLHPYQYIYYNELVGGVRGASGRFELDYWATAMREAMQELNQLAPNGSRVVIWSASVETAQVFARPDLLVEREQGGTYDVETGYHYAIVQLGATRNTTTPYPNAPILIRVERDGIPLAIVKLLNPP